MKNNIYSCGICSKGVRTSAVCCSGLCKKWFHIKCINMAEETYRNLLKGIATDWKCSCCIAENESTNKIEKLKEKIIDLEEEENPDLESSLLLAAEVGNELLKENDDLKKELHETKLLIKQIQEEYENNIKDIEDEKFKIIEDYEVKLKENTLESKYLVNKLKKEAKLANSLCCELEETNKQIHANILELEKALKNEKLLHAEQISRNEILLKNIKVKDDELVYLKTNLNKSTQCNESNEIKVTDSLLLYHTNYPNDSFRILAKRLETDLNLYKDKSDRLYFENSKLKEESKNLKCIINTLNEEFSLPDTTINSTSSYPPLLTSDHHINDFIQVKPAKTCREPLTKTQTLINTKNKYECLTHLNDEDGSVGDIYRQAVSDPLDKKTWSSSRRAKSNPNTNIQQSGNSRGEIVILSDSHGRKLGNSIQRRTMDSVFSVCRPGARLSGVTHDVRELTKHLTKKDCLVIIGGTNDLENTEISSLLNEYSKVLDSTTNTNVILSTLPLRYDNPDLLLKCTHLNKKLINIVNQTEHTCLLPLHELPRRLHTSQGLHFNYKGKNKISEMIVQLVKEIKSCTNKDKQLVSPARTPTSLNTSSTSSAGSTPTILTVQAMVHSPPRGPGTEYCPSLSTCSPPEVDMASVSSISTVNETLSCVQKNLLGLDLVLET